MESQGVAKEYAYHVEAASASENNEKIIQTAMVDGTNPVYEEEDIEPEVHIRTWVAVAAMLFLNFVQVISLQGPPVVASQQQLAVPSDNC